MQANTLRPGLLIGLKTSISGNVKFSKIDIEPDHPVDGGGRLARWETKRTIADTTEHDEAVKVRSKVRALIAGVCASSAFGLLCPEAATDKLEEAINQARLLADEFNSSAKITRLGVNIIAGRIAPDDKEAARAIGSEMLDLLSEMSRGTEQLDVENIRKAAKRARDVSRMLTPQMQARVGDAIATARATARKIAKAGERAALEVDVEAVRSINSARTVFLDLDDPVDAIAVPVIEGRALDLDPAAAAAETDQSPAAAPSLDME